MKKMLIGISTVVVMGIGGVLVAVQINDEEPKQTTVASNESEPVAEETKTEPETQTEEEVVTIPTERTVDTGVNAPWQFYKSEMVADLQEKGETVYLFSDAEAIEEYIVSSVNSVIPEGAPATLKDITTSAANHLSLFVSEVSQYVDNQAYFDKLKEVEQALLNEQYNQALTLIEEAKTLRES